MFGIKKETPQIDKDQLELLKTAQKRIKQKKRLYVHFVIFLIGSVFLILFNLGLGFGKEFKPLETNWFVFAILFWLFLFLYHAFNVFITHKFMGKRWEEEQLSKLILKQEARIDVLKKEVSEASEIEKKKLIRNHTTQKLTIIAAAADNNAIGKHNKLIWHLSDDLKRFKSLTSGHHIIMGRKTFESFPKPLPNRTHVVISRNSNYTVPEGVILVNNLNDAIEACKTDPQPFVIGGGEIYKQAILVADKIELTRVHESFAADTFFPEIDPALWKKTAATFNTKNAENEFDFTFLTYVKV